jgi:hypothetical protein
MAIEIVDLPIKHGGSFHSYVCLPEGIYMMSTILKNMSQWHWEGLSPIYNGKFLKISETTNQYIIVYLYHRIKNVMSSTMFL